MAFADGVPRIGEAILEVKAIKKFYWNVWQPVEYPDDNGPDGKPLNLKQKAEKIKEIERPDHETFLDSVLANAWAEEVNTDIYLWTPINHSIGVQTTFIRHENMIGRYAKDKCQMHLTTIGPILYLICAGFRGEPYDVPSSSAVHDDWNGIGSLGNDPNCKITDSNIFPWGGHDPDDLWMHYDNCTGGYNPIRPQIEAFLANLNASANQWSHPKEYWETVYTHLAIYAAIYTKKLYNQVKHSSNLDWDWSNDQLKTVPPGFTYQQYLSQTIKWPQGEPYGLTIKAKDGIEYYFRPHTKEELQAAGMWPKDK
jgi:hypothetical protein